MTTIQSEQDALSVIEFNPNHFMRLEFGDVGTVLIRGWEAEEHWKMIKQLVDKWFELEREKTAGIARVFKRKNE